MQFSNQRCYISGKISNLPKEEYETYFEKGEAEVRQMCLIPISPLKICHVGDFSWHQYMKTDIKSLIDCEFLYALNNWRDSKGAVLEIELSMRLGIHILFQP